MRFDDETLDRFRVLAPPEAFRAAKHAVWAAGPVGSEDFLDIYEQLIEEGILTRDQIEEFDERL